MRVMSAILDRVTASVEGEGPLPHDLEWRRPASPALEAPGPLADQHLEPVDDPGTTRRGPVGEGGLVGAVHQIHEDRGRRKPREAEGPGVRLARIVRLAPA